MGFPMNCDAFTFMGSAIDPSYLIKPGFVRQSRPLYIILGTATGYVLYYAGYPFHEKIRAAIKNKFSKDFSETEQRKSVEYVFSYAGFILINAITLLIAFLLFEKIVFRLSGDWKNSRFLFLLLLMMLASNQVTKTFFWTPHQQIFNILTPLLCVYAGLQILSNKPSEKKTLLTSLGAGFLVLVYGSFLLLLPLIVFCYLYNTKKYKQESNLKRLLISLLLTVVFFLPTLCWIIFLRLIGVGFYSYELTEFRQFVWLKDVFQMPGKSAWQELYLNTLAFIKTFGSVFFAGGLLLLVFLYRKFFRPAANDPIKNTVNSGQLFLFWFVIALFLLFFWLLGYYADRLTFSLAPLLLCISAILINRDKINKAVEWLLIALFLGFHFYTVFFDAPHFSDGFYH
jgi:hypothetical protein